MSVGSTCRICPLCSRSGRAVLESSHPSGVFARYIALLPLSYGVGLRVILLLNWFGEAEAEAEVFGRIPCCVVVVVEETPPARLEWSCVVSLTVTGTEDSPSPPTSLFEPRSACASSWLMIGVHRSNCSSALLSRPRNISNFALIMVSSYIYRVICNGLYKEKRY
jgi:hypothetical protein